MSKTVLLIYKLNVHASCSCALFKPQRSRRHTNLNYMLIVFISYKPEPDLNPKIFMKHEPEPDLKSASLSGPVGLGYVVSCGGGAGLG